MKWRWDEDCECFICGGHRVAYSYPPVCAKCRDEYEFEVHANKTMRELAEAEKDDGA